MNAINSRSLNFNRVLVVDNQGIMGAGMEKLLSKEPSLEVIGITTENETALIQNISRLQPDTVILTLESRGTTPTRLLELLYDYGRLQIIRVSMNSNMLEIYEKKKLRINSVGALLSQLTAKHETTEIQPLA